ncbi:hypothetical protein DPMN_024656 [Dreissena polymorpha]|uniref:Uncharacterized protein n=1 Tax=Dreissena polymorpha TaxID=45954 RepID=A0A9D4RCJ2_DREPO|nr:hypothetical protein DPMN_024656 [Dreissena polymorpha]
MATMLQQAKDKDRRLVDCLRLNMRYACAVLMRRDKMFLTGTVATKERNNSTEGW